MTAHEAWRTIESWERYGWLTPDGADTPDRLQRAQCIAPVAKAMADLSSLDGRLVMDITEGDRQPHMVSDRGAFVLGRFLLYNNYPPGYGLIDTRPFYSEVWGPYADLGLVAVTLEIRMTFNGLRSTMTLALPAWHRGGNHDARPLNLLRVSSDGLLEVKSCALYKRDDTRGRIGKPLALIPTMEYFLGIRTPAEHGWPESSDLRHVRFPGAYDYFQTYLPTLGEYLSGVVAMHEAAAERTK